MTFWNQELLFSLSPSCILTASFSTFSAPSLCRIDLFSPSVFSLLGHAHTHTLYLLSSCVIYLISLPSPLPLSLPRDTTLIGPHCLSSTRHFQTGPIPNISSFSPASQLAILELCVALRTSNWSLHLLRQTLRAIKRLRLARRGGSIQESGAWRAQASTTVHTVRVPRNHRRLEALLIDQ